MLMPCFSTQMLPTLKLNDEDKLAGVVPVQRYLYIQILHFQTQSYRRAGSTQRNWGSECSQGNTLTSMLEQLLAIATRPHNSCSIK